MDETWSKDCLMGSETAFPTTVLLCFIIVRVTIFSNLQTSNFPNKHLEHIFHTFSHHGYITGHQWCMICVFISTKMTIDDTSHSSCKKTWYVGIPLRIKYVHVYGNEHLKQWWIGFNIVVKSKLLIGKTYSAYY